MKTMCAKCGASMKKGGTTKKMKKGGITQEIVGMPGYNATTRPITMKKGGAKKTLTKARKGIAVGDSNIYVMNKTNAFGKPKHKEISKNKFDRLSNRFAKQEGSESLGTNTSVAQQVLSGRNPKKSVTRVDEVKKAELNKNGRGYSKIPKKIKMKTGGASKTKNFAALAPPYDKATYADRIAGAKKRKK